MKSMWNKIYHTTGNINIGVTDKLLSGILENYE